MDRPRRNAAIQAEAKLKETNAKLNAPESPLPSKSGAKKVTKKVTKKVAAPAAEELAPVKEAKKDLPKAAAVVVSKPTVPSSSLTTTITQVSTPRECPLPLPTLPSPGHLFTLGEQLSGELGPRESCFSGLRVMDYEPSLVKLPSKSLMVACGDFHTLVLTEEGKVLTFGINSDGQLGRTTNGTEEEKISAEALPVEGPLSGKSVIKVTAGDRHSAALDAEGNVYLWGNISKFFEKIGLFSDDAEKDGKYQPTRFPRQVELPDDIELTSTIIVDIASGSDHLLMLTSEGEVLSLGDGSLGQLGRTAVAGDCSLDADNHSVIGSQRDFFIVPGKVDFSKADYSKVTTSSSQERPQIERIFAGQQTSFALSESGQLFAWGLNNFSQMGFSSVFKDDFVFYTELFPVAVPLFRQKQRPKVISVSAGIQHVAVLTSNGTVFTAGSTENGKLGLGLKVLNEVLIDECLNELTPIPLEAFGGEPVAEVVCGHFCTFAITAHSGSLFAWGQGSKHIGTDEDKDVWEPMQVKGPFVVKGRARFVSGSSGTKFGAWIGKLQQ